MRISDWSSDVCSSDLGESRDAVGRGDVDDRSSALAREAGARELAGEEEASLHVDIHHRVVLVPARLHHRLVERTPGIVDEERSAERSVGTECVRTCCARWSLVY